MTIIVLAPDASDHPLEPVRAAVLDVSHGAPLLTLGTDSAAAWYPGDWLADPASPALAGVLDTVAKRWGLGRHGAAAIAFKGYAWAATLPVLAGWLGHRRIPILDSGRLHVGVASDLPLVRFDLSRAVVYATFLLRPGDKAAAARHVLTKLGGPLPELVEVHEGADGPTVRRRTCCLWFTGEAGRGDYCSTCCVVR